MYWLDVAGPPGVGKSTLCDPFWHPHAFQPDDRRPPLMWRPYLDEITRLFRLIQWHWSFVPAVRMTRRSVRKIATVARMEGGPYIQTGLVQRGLGFGWRLNQIGMVDEVRGYFRLMPVSIGIAMLHADPATIAERNRKRLLDPRTAHENRDFMVPLMAEPQRIATEVFRERGVPVVTIDTGQPIEEARRRLSEFASQTSFDAASSGPGCQVEVLQAPPWWG